MKCNIGRSAAAHIENIMVTEPTAAHVEPVDAELTNMAANVSTEMH